MWSPSRWSTFSCILGLDFPDDSLVAFAAGFPPFRRSSRPFKRPSHPVAPGGREIRKSLPVPPVVVPELFGLDFWIDVWCSHFGPAPQFISQNKDGGGSGCARFLLRNLLAL